MPRAAEASMTKRRHLLALGIIGALLATVALITPLRLLVLGFFSREHFYRGMPSSYWSFTIQNWWHNIDEGRDRPAPGDRKSTRLNSSHGSISYAVFCLKK